jgi:hypothetical protein
MAVLEASKCRSLAHTGSAGSTISLTSEMPANKISNQCVESCEVYTSQNVNAEAFRARRAAQRLPQSALMRYAVEFKLGNRRHHSVVEPQ